MALEIHENKVSFNDTLIVVRRERWMVEDSPGFERDENDKRDCQLTTSPHVARKYLRWLLEKYVKEESPRELKNGWDLRCCRISGEVISGWKLADERWPMGDEREENGRLAVVTRLNFFLGRLPGQNHRNNTRPPRPRFISTAKIRLSA